MDRDTTQVDLEHGVIPSLQLPSITATLCGSTSSTEVSLPHSTKASDSASAIEEMFSPDDEIDKGQTQTNDLVVDDLHLKDPGPTGQAKGDPPDKILGLYLSQAGKSDKEDSESWRANTDGVLVFTGVFSATVAAFIIVSYQSLLPDSTDATVRLLSQISQQLTAISDGTPLPAPLILPDATSFQPTPAAVRVNVMWFASLSMSTACALWATLMQQWARRFVQIADRPYVTPKQARIRAYFANGVEKFGLATAVEVLPMLLHSSVLLFYIGLIDFLLHINYTVGFTVLLLVALCVLAYFVLSIMPLFCHNSPYLTPLSVVIWFVREAVPLIKLWFLQRGEEAERNMKAGLDKLKRGMDEALADTGTSKTWEMDPKTLHRTMLSLDEDHKLEDFLDALPALFRNVTSNSYNDLRTALEPHIMRVTRRLLGTCSTGQLHNSARRQRLTACLDAIWCFRKTMERYFSVVRDHWMHGGDGKHDHWALLSTEAWAMATKMTADSDPITALHAHCVQALIAVMRQHKRWDCSKAEWSAHLHRQLSTPVDVIERHLDSEANHLQLAVAANLLTHALPLLRDIEAKDGHATSLKLKAEVKAILDSICNGMDASDVPEDLQIRFVDAKEVKEVFHVRQPGLRAYRHRIDMTGSWTNVFVPGSTSDTGEGSTGSKSARPPNLTARLGHFIRRENIA